MNESFMRKVYENPTENVMQQGLNFYSQQFKSLIKTFPSADIPIFLAAMKSVHDGIRGVLPANGPELEDDILKHITTVVIPFPGGEKRAPRTKTRSPARFMIQACRCRRCGGLLTSKEGVRNGIGHVCRMKALREMPDPNQVTVFDVLGDKEENTHEK